MSLKVRFRALIALALLLLFSGSATGDEADILYEPGQIIVKFAPEAGEVRVKRRGGVISLNRGSLDRKLKRYGGCGIRQLFPHKSSELGLIYQIDFDPFYDAQMVACDFARDEGLLYAEPRYRHKPCEAPNDPAYQLGVQWYLDKVHAPDAWDITHGDSAVVIGIVDTGVDWNHPDLWGNIWVNPGEDWWGNGRDDDENGYIDDKIGWDFGGMGYPDNNPNEDGPIHGTHVAGIASAVTNNDTGVAGMSWNCTIMAVKVCQNGEPNFIYGYEGIQYAADNGAQVINLGWVRSDVPSAFEQEIIDSAFAKGAILVASAGNDPGVTPPDTCLLSYPAGYEHVTAVAATDQNDRALNWTYYGTWVDVSAPGKAIYNTWWNDIYVMLQGTSNSCALVSGVAALLKVTEPGMNSDDFEYRMRTTSDDIDSLNPGYEGLLGGGRLNAYRALMNIVSVEELEASSKAMPSTYVLHQNYPNPFNSNTEIRYQIPKDGHVTLKIFNILSQEVRTLVDGQKRAGEYGVGWDGRDSRGQEVASGLYFCRLQAADYSKTIKMVLMK